MLSYLYLTAHHEDGLPCAQQRAQQVGLHNAAHHAGVHIRERREDVTVLAGVVDPSIAVAERLLCELR